MRRRNFVTAVSAASLPLLLPRELLGRAWRVQPVGLQLYTVRGLMEADFEGTLAAVAKAGYREVEFAGYFDKTPAQVKQALKKTGLTAPSAHVPFTGVDTDWRLTIGTANAIGLKYVVVPSVPEEMRQTLGDWKRLGQQFNQAALVARESGLQFAYHNHEYEFVPIDGQVPYDVLLESTDPKLVKLEMDLFWIRKAGQSPFTYFKRWPGRFPMVHVKDMTAAGEMTDVGAGIIDWNAIYAARKEAGIQHWFVEHDEPADPMTSIRASYEYMKDLD